MEKIRIVTDSSCDLPSDFLENTGIDFSIVPLKVIVDGKEFVDDDTMDVENLLAAMKASKNSSSSACPSPEEFAAEMRKNEKSICLTMTSALSGTYNSACLGAGFVREENEKAKAEVIDSLSTSATLILLIMKLKEYITSGMDFETVYEKIMAYQKTLKLRFVLFDLSNLIKTGRMSKVAGVFASVLSLCPVLGDNGKGEIKVMDKVRGVNQAISHMANLVEEKLKTTKDFPVVITHCDNEEHANVIKNMLAERFGLKDVHIFPMRGLASFYANHKGIIMSY